MILSKTEYIDSVNYLLPDNSTQLISPLDIRTSFINLADSVHNMLDGQMIKSANFASLETRTTRAGELSISSYSLPGRVNVDNTAVGYYSLGGNYDGAFNTAIGSNSLGCNLYGDYNVGLGYNSLAGNLTGSGNIGLGSHTLQANKHGSFNIAIGHGAGYYIGQSDSYKLFVASHSVDSSLCDANSSGTPLIHGDLKGLKLAIASNKIDSVFSVRKNNSLIDHANEQYIQSWFCDDIRVAAIDCNGNLYTGSGIDGISALPDFIEGVMEQAVSSPASVSSPTSGILNIINSNGSVIGSTYIINKDTSLDIPDNVFVVAKKINGTYRPVWVGCE
jgi:hypothetical protein